MVLLILSWAPLVDNHELTSGVAGAGFYGPFNCFMLFLMS